MSQTSTKAEKPGLKDDACLPTKSLFDLTNRGRFSPSFQGGCRGDHFFAGATTSPSSLEIRRDHLAKEELDHPLRRLKKLSMCVGPEAQTR